MVSCKVLSYMAGVECVGFVEYVRSFRPPYTPYFLGIQQYIGPRVPREIHKGASWAICGFTQYLSEVLQSGNLWPEVALVLPSVWGECFAQQHRLTISWQQC